MLKGYVGKILDVNLADQSFQVRDLDEEFAKLYVGGKGFGVKLLYDNLPAGIEPLSPENILIFSTGPLTGSQAPQSNRFVVSCKSPLTGLIGTSTCGGNFATKMKSAGFDIIIVRGKAAQPMYLKITDRQVEFLDAGELWGLGTYEVQERFPKEYGKAVIGPAGEHLVKYAAIVSQERLAGRCGTGAVMGSKNLKAIIAKGAYQAEKADEEGFKKLREEIIAYKKGHPMLGDVLPRLGTINLVMTTAGRNIMPTRNFQKGHHRDASKVCGEELAEHHLVKRGGCISCPVLCGRVVKRGDKNIKGPEFESTAAFSSYIENFDIKNVFEWNYLADDYGLDSISTGSSIAFAMELTEKGLLSSELKFGRTDNISQTIADIAYRRGLGNELAEGTKWLAEKYGGKEFAINVKGLELPAYDPRGCYGQGLEYATTNRGGCHVQGATMYMEATGPLSIDPHATKGKPELVMIQQNIANGVSSLVMCLFSTYGLIPAAVFNLQPHGWIYKTINQVVQHAGPVLRLTNKFKLNVQVNWFEKFYSRLTGVPMSMSDFIELGERIFNLERMFNLREGMTKEADTLPKRLLKESTFPGIKGGVPLEAMLPQYYRARGWNQDGIPTEATLKRLRIQA
jgi:aldehyde:ferredoxin oxidoreductase